MKKCWACGETKPLDDFGANRSKSDGRSTECRSCVRRLSAERYRRNPEKYRADELRRRYGITPDEYDDILADQGGACACCGASDAGHHGTFHVDHEHSTGKVRGLLCSNCNTGIGKLGDDLPGVLRAVNYLLRAA